MAELKNAKTGLGMRGKSSSSRWAEESRKQARESGELPHEFLLRVSRGEPVEVVEVEEGVPIKKLLHPSFQDRVDAANICANYFAPKLTAQQVENMDPLVEMTDEELDKKLAELEAESGR